jgi:uncharacterized RDD family membrane protein YckC
MSAPTSAPPPPGQPPAPAPQFSFGGYAAGPEQIEGVGFWPRVGARLIDFVVQYIVAICAGLVFGFALGIIATMLGKPVSVLAMKMRHIGFAGIGVSLLAAVAYHTICESVHGSTAGKMLLGYVVVKEDRSPCTFDSALLRSFAYFVDGLFFGLVGYAAMKNGPLHQRYGDQWAHTVVYRRSQLPPASLRDGNRFVLALFLGMMAHAILLMIGWLLAITVL